MNKYVLDENGFLISYKDWMSGRETVKDSIRVLGSSSTKKQRLLPTKKQSTIKPRVDCPICNVSVQQDRLEKHMSKVHSNEVKTSRDTNR